MGEADLCRAKIWHLQGLESAEAKAEPRCFNGVGSSYRLGF